MEHRSQQREDIDMDNIGKRLRQLRRERRLTQEELADIAQISVKTVQKIEQGGSSRIETYNSLALALGVEVVWFPSPQPQTNFGQGHLISHAFDIPDSKLLFTTDICPLSADEIRKVARRTGAALEQKYSLLGGSHVCDVAVSVYERINLWTQSDYPHDIANALETFLAEFGIWLGWIAVDAGRHDVAQKHLNEALVHARMVNRSILEACALNNLSVLYIRKMQPNKALRAANIALDITQNIPPRLRALFHLRGAIACGYLSDDEGYGQHALEAQRDFERGSSIEEPTWFRSFSEHELVGLLGWGHLIRGRGREATMASAYAESHTEGRANIHYKIQLARALVMQGAYAEAADNALSILPKLRQLHSAPVISDFKALQTSMALGRHPKVTEFLVASRDFEFAQ